MTGTYLKRTLVIAAAVAATSLYAAAADTGWNLDGNGDFNDPANWVNGDINGIWDSSLTLTAARVITFGEDTVLSGPLGFYYTGNYNLDLRADGNGARTLTLGGDITVNTGSNIYVTLGSTTGNQNLFINLGGESRAFDVIGPGNKYLQIRNPISSTNVTDGITKAGGGTLYLNNGANPYTGETVVTGGTLWMASTARAVDSDFSVTGATLRFDSSGSGMTSMTRAASLSVHNATVNGTAASSTSVNTNDIVTGALSLKGNSTISLAPHSSRNMRFTFGGLSRDDYGTVLLRGTALGVNPMSPATIGAANITFTDIALAGGEVNTTSAGIIKGAYGDVTTSGNGAGLVTHDSTYGVRQLAETEYITTLADGHGSGTEAAIENVRLSNSAGTGPLTTTLTTNTTVNSLSLYVSGANTPEGSGLRIEGEGALKVTSGVIYASQLVTGASGSGNANNAMVIAAPLDLNGGEGVFITLTNNVSNGQSNSPLTLAGSIGNDGGEGITFAGPGIVYYQGTDHTYTGDTRVNSGFLRILSALPGNLVINGGTAQNTGNRVGDDADIYITGGTLLQKGGASNSGSGAHETFRDLYMTGGTFTSGASGTSSGTTNLRDATLSGGTWQLTKGHAGNMTGALDLSGGVVSLVATGDSVSAASLSTTGLTITNTSRGAYTPISMGNSTGTGFPSRLTLNGDLTFHPSANANPVTITAATGPKVGMIILPGTSTFTIPDGPAADDLVIFAGLVDGAQPGALVKTGAGTLALYGESTITGGTTVNDGTLLVNGSLAGPITITGTGTLGGSGSVGSTLLAAGGTLAPGNSPGVLTIAGDLELVAGSKFIFDLGADAATSDRVDVSGILTLDAQQFSDFTFIFGTEPLQESYILFSSAGIVGSLGGNLAGDVGGNSMSLSVVGNDVILAIPEPGIAGLAVMVGLGALARRRPRRA